MRDLDLIRAPLRWRRLMNGHDEIKCVMPGTQGLSRFCFGSIFQMDFYNFALNKLCHKIVLTKGLIKYGTHRVKITKNPTQRYIYFFPINTIYLTCFSVSLAVYRKSLPSRLNNGCGLSRIKNTISAGILPRV